MWSVDLTHIQFGYECWWILFDLLRTNWKIIKITDIKRLFPIKHRSRPPTSEKTLVITWKFLHKASKWVKVRFLYNVNYNINPSTQLSLFIQTTYHSPTVQRWKKVIFFVKVNDRLCCCIFISVKYFIKRKKLQIYFCCSLFLQVY